MVKVFEEAPTSFSGDQISGGIIKNFSSTGIQDFASTPTLTVTDGKLSVPAISVGTVEGNTVIRGDVKIYGILDAGYIRTTEVIANQRYEKQYLEFSNQEGSSVGCGLLWNSGNSKQFVLRTSPDRFWSSEHFDIPADKSYLINEIPVITQDSLGVGIVKSNLESVGTLKNFRTSGDFVLDNFIHYNCISQRLGIGTDIPSGLVSILDYVNNVEIIIDSDKSTGYGKIGTFSTKGFSIVTDDTARITISENGNITLGQELKDSTIVRTYGKFSVGVKNPTAQFEVAGDVRLGNRLFTNGNCPPESGQYQIGDIVWNTNPRPNSHVGWICISTGAPGGWRGFGLIDP